MPLRDWLLGPLKEQMNDYCAGDDLVRLGLNGAFLRERWREFADGRQHRPDVFWQAFVLIAWSRRYLTARAST